MIKVGLPKGNVKEKSIKFIEKVLGENLSEKKLSVICGVYQFYLLKHRDIPRLINDGFLDIGITSHEWLIENQTDLVELAVTDWCNTRISLITSPTFDDEEYMCVTEYPHVAEKYFAEQNKKHSVFLISGSSESMVPMIFNSSVDCVETGKTLVANGLVEKEVILYSSMVLVARTDIEINDAIKYLINKIYE